MDAKITAPAAHQIHAVVTPEQVLMENVVFFDRQVNNVMSNAWFARVVLGGSLLTTIGVNMLTALRPIALVPCFNNSNKLTVVLGQGDSRATALRHKERDILSKYTPLTAGKHMRTTLSDNIGRGFIVVVKESCRDVAETLQQNKRCDAEFVVNVSGVWENATEYGITFKIIAVKRRLAPETPASCSGQESPPS